MSMKSTKGSAPLASKRHRLPMRRKGIRFLVGEYHVSTGEFEDGTLGELFIHAPHEGSFMKDILNAFAMTISIGLQHGVPLEAFQHTFRNFNADPDVVRGIFKELEKAYGRLLPKEANANQKAAQLTSSP